MLPLRDVLQEYRVISPFAYSRHSSDGAICPRLFASSQGVGQRPQDFIPDKHLLVARNHENQPPFFSQPIALSKCSPVHYSASSFPSLALLCNHSSLPFTSPMLFSPPNHISSLPTFFNEASSLPLVVKIILLVLKLISGVFRMV